jgi:hypothetical protein
MPETRHPAAVFAKIRGFSAISGLASALRRNRLKL